jgi:ribosomal protein S1
LRYNSVCYSKIRSEEIVSEKAIIQPTSIDELQPKMCVEGVVTRTELYGAFVDIGIEQKGLIHISRLDNKRINKVTDKVNVGDKVKVWILNVDSDQGRIGLTMVEPPDVDWDELDVGQVHVGQVVRMERYGAFIDIGAERPGLLHVREMGQYVRNPSEIMREGEKVEVKISRVDRRKRMIDFTMHLGTEDMVFDEEENEDPALSAMEVAFREAQGDTKSFNRGGRNRRRSKRQSKHGDLEDIYKRTLRHGN